MANIGSINFGGLASGLDTKTIIEQLVAVDSKPLQRLETQQTDLTKKKDTYAAMKTDLLTLKSAASELRNPSTFGVFSASSSDEEALTLSALPTAREGSHRVKIVSLAEAKTLSGNSYTATDTPLGLSGEILVNGTGFRIRSSNTLQDIATGINTLDNGVTASILKVADSDNRLILTAATQGEKGFTIANAGSTDILGSIGLTDGTKQVREAVDGSVRSFAFSAADSTIGSLAGITTQASGSVKIRNRTVSLDLSNDTLASIRDKINTLGLSGVTAAVETSSDSGSTVYRLTVSGTQDFTDSGNVLETLGILEGGTEGTKAKFTTASLVPSNGHTTLSESTKFSSLGSAANGTAETITITGTDSEGTAVSKTIQIGKNSTVKDLLTGIEAAYSGNVRATVENDMIAVESTTAGETDLSFRIRANNENGGTLDFGSVSTAEIGRGRLLAAGSDAVVLINNTTVKRNSNAFSDAVQGITLSLKKADPTKEIVITVNRDTDALKTKVEGFVKSYNDIVDFVEKNSAFDETNKTAGPLSGEITSRTVMTRLRNSLQQSFGGDGYDYTHLFQVGIEFTSTGRLTIDTEKFGAALKDNIDAVTKLFTVTRTSSDSDVAFSYSTVKTKPGSYQVVVTKASEKAAVTSADLTTGAPQGGTLTVTDNFGSSMNIEVAGGDSASDIANRINTEAAKTYEEVIRNDKTVLRSDGGTITQDTKIGNIAGVSASDGDTITVTGTDHSGRTYQRRLILSGPDSHTVQDILTAIERMADRNVSASIDSDGRIRVQDNTAGTSRLAVSISSTVRGLDLGSFTSVQKGRNTVTVDASTSGNRLTLTQKAYGTTNTFTVSGGAAVGLADGTFRGINIEGTINGTAASGSGQILNASASDTSAQGIAVRVSLTPEDLAAAGSSRSTITLVSGAADALFGEVSALADTAGGFVQTKIDSYDRTLKTLISNINDASKRLNTRKDLYTQKFAKLEGTLSRLQSVQQQLGSSLTSLSAVRR